MTKEYKYTYKFSEQSVDTRYWEIKSNKKLQEISLIKQPRLSVMPITKEHWDIILEMGETSI